MDASVLRKLQKNSEKTSVELIWTSQWIRTSQPECNQQSVRFSVSVHHQSGWERSATQGHCWAWPLWPCVTVGQGGGGPHDNWQRSGSMGAWFFHKWRWGHLAFVWQILCITWCPEGVGRWKWSDIISPWLGVCQIPVKIGTWWRKRCVGKLPRWNQRPYGVMLCAQKSEDSMCSIYVSTVNKSWVSFPNHGSVPCQSTKSSPKLLDHYLFSSQPTKILLEMLSLSYSFGDKRKNITCFVLCFFSVSWFLGVILRYHVVTLYLPPYFFL